MPSFKQTQDDAPTRIINATLALLAEKGSDALRTREILERAGIANLSAISYYFGSLDALRSEALERYFAGARPVLEGLEAAEDPRAALLGYCRRMAGFVLANPTLERNMVALAMAGGPAAGVFTRMITENIRALQRLILRGRVDLTPTQAESRAIALASAVIYPLLLAAYGPSALGVDAASEDARERYFADLVAMALA